MAIVVTDEEASQVQSPPTKGIKSTISSSHSPKNSQLPRNLVQEVIGAQQLVIIEYVTQVLFNSFQEKTKAQLFEITSKLKQLPREVISRVDSVQRSP